MVWTKFKRLGHKLATRAAWFARSLFSKSWARPHMIGLGLAALLCFVAMGVFIIACGLHGLTPLRDLAGFSGPGELYFGRPSRRPFDREFAAVAVNLTLAVVCLSILGAADSMALIATAKKRRDERGTTLARRCGVLFALAWFIAMNWHLVLIL